MHGQQGVAVVILTGKQQFRFFFASVFSSSST
jgi:hypothetical protein